MNVARQFIRRYAIIRSHDRGDRGEELPAESITNILDREVHL